MRNLLILCTGNSCRSQMAEGYLKKFAGAKFNVYSAGIVAHGVNPTAIKVMAEDDVDISDHSSKTVDDLSSISVDVLLTVCDNAKENCPYLPGKFLRFHNNFPDPAKATGTDEEILDEFRKVRDLIKTYSIKLATQL